MTGGNPYVKCCKDLSIPKRLNNQKHRARTTMDCFNFKKFKHCEYFCKELQTKISTLCSVNSAYINLNSAEL